MAALRPFDKMPGLNTAALLLVGAEEHLQEQLTEALLREPKPFTLNVHMAKSLPLPAEGDAARPRIDLVVFLVNLQSQFSYSTVQASLAHLDAGFFLGKVCFLATGGGRVKHCSVEMHSMKKLADTYLSMLIFTDLESEGSRTHTAQQLLQMLRICAGHVPGVSSLYLTSVLKRPLLTSQDD